MASVSQNLISITADSDTTPLPPHVLLVPYISHTRGQRPRREHKCSGESLHAARAYRSHTLWPANWPRAGAQAATGGGGCIGDQHRQHPARRAFALRADVPRRHNMRCRSLHRRAAARHTHELMFRNVSGWEPEMCGASTGRMPSSCDRDMVTRWESPRVCGVVDKAAAPSHLSSMHLQWRRQRFDAIAPKTSRVQRTVRRRPARGKNTVQIQLPPGAPARRLDVNHHGDQQPW